MTAKTTNEPTETIDVKAETETIEYDEFCSPEYVNADAKMPLIQALRGATKATCGFWVFLENALAAGFTITNEKDLKTYTFEAEGNEEPGLHFPNPRCIVVPKSPLFVYDRAVKDRLEIVGPYSADLKQQSQTYSNGQIYWLMLLDSNNQPLHQTPLEFVAKGANQATFAQHWQQLCREVELCHAQNYNIAGLEKDSRFRSLCVFAFQTARETAYSTTTDDKGPACKVVSHDEPTMQNWRDYFLGYSGRKDWFWSAMMPMQLATTHDELVALQGQEAKALPAAQ